MLALALLAATALGSGCTNNLFKAASQALNSGVTASNPFSGNGGSGGGAPLTLTKVAKDNTDPNGTLDLFGDGSGAMQQFCAAAQGQGGGGAGGGAQGPNSGPTTCSCHYSYIKSDGTSEAFDMPTTYHERNQIRCNYSQIPGNVPFIRVSVHLTNADVFSNEVVFRFLGTGISLDLANPNTFAQAQRYQCRDIVTIPYLFDGSIYDPILSADPRYTYPLDFYSTNMGGTMAVYASNSLSSGGAAGQGAGGAVQGWDCPAIPNDSSAGMDLSLFSAYGDASGSKQIYPPNGVFDRSTFFVAKGRSGVFNVPVNAMGAPSLLTCDVNAAGQPQGCSLPTLGFGAQPVPAAGGGETCPDSSVTIPAGFHWVKVWLFRMQMPQRMFPHSDTLLGLNQLACNPGPWDPVNAPSVVPYPDCKGEPILGSSGASLAARFSKGTGQCFLVDPGWTTDPTLPPPNQQRNSSDGAVTNDPQIVAPGTDRWRPANVDVTFGCTGSKVNDVAGTCGGDHIPKDLHPSPPGTLDTATNPRFDFLFVVSPPSVMASDMLNTHSTVLGVYTPFRFMAPNDCMSSDPDAPKFVGDCSPARMLNQYTLKLQDVGTNSDPSATDPQRTGVFPVCALQPN